MLHIFSRYLQQTRITSLDKTCTGHVFRRTFRAPATARIPQAPREIKRVSAHCPPIVLREHCWCMSFALHAGNTAAFVSLWSRDWNSLSSSATSNWPGWPTDRTKSLLSRRWRKEDTYIFFHRFQYQALELVQTLIYSSTPAFLHDRFIALQSGKDILLLFNINSIILKFQRGSSNATCPMMLWYLLIRVRRKE